MKMRVGMKIRWMGSKGDSNLTRGAVYTFFKEENGRCRILEDGDEERFYPLEQFESVEVKPGAKVRWRGQTEWLMLTHGQIYTVLSVEREWFRVIDDSGEDYLYPPDAFEIVDPG